MAEFNMEVAPELKHFLVSSGLSSLEDTARWIPLTGGVSSDIWKVELRDRTLCIKRALPKLKVAADWEAPVSRNAFEWEWLKFAAEQVPAAVPVPIAHDLEAGLFAMEFLPIENHPLWKQQLLDGNVDTSVARALGVVLGTLHAVSANSDVLAKAFATDESFFALRLEPYLLATARRHPKLAARLEELVAITASHHEALVHGDISPKNILVGPNGPVILDAECAWYGDPAFDIAFLLNHMLLKCLVNPLLKDQYLACFNSFLEGYFSKGRAAEVEQRAAALLPALLLARVDGKSPVEYLVTEPPKQLIRDFAPALITTPETQLSQIAALWNTALDSLV
jgi:aminoglycoside phosphotransferase (APT) family kinase protein